jgi:hypothetical protein
VHKIIETRVDDWLDSVEDQLFNYSHDRNNIEWPRQYSRTVFAVLVDLPVDPSAHYSACGDHLLFRQSRRR